MKRQMILGWLAFVLAATAIAYGLRNVECLDCCCQGYELGDRP